MFDSGGSVAFERSDSSLNRLTAAMKRLFYLALLACALFGCRPTEKSAQIVFFRETAPLHSYATVPWAKLVRNHWRPNRGNWDQEVEKHLEATAFPYEIAVAYWEQLQSAREFVHQRSLPLRAVATPEFVERLDQLEAAFDTVFLRCISESYYMRLLPDIYNEVIPERLDVLVQVTNSKEDY